MNIEALIKATIAMISIIGLMVLAVLYPNVVGITLIACGLLLLFFALYTVFDIGL